MSWKPEIDEIQRRRERAAEHGGVEAVERQHARGRLTVRERVDQLVDRDSFREYGRITGEATTDPDGRLESFTPANTVLGTAAIEGRRVVVCGDDFTIRGAAYSQVGLKKALFADEFAVRRRLPLVRLLEAGGASIAGASGTRGRSGYDMTAPPQLNVLALEALACVPVACAALGPVAGYPAGRLVASHFSIMTRDTAQVLVVPEATSRTPENGRSVPRRVMCSKAACAAALKSGSPPNSSTHERVFICGAGDTTVF